MKRALPIIVCLFGCNGKSMMTMNNADGGAVDDAGALGSDDGGSGGPLSISEVALQFVSDDSGATGSAGGEIVMVFEPGGVVDFYNADDQNAAAFTGSYSYDGAMMTLQLTATDFSRSATFALDLSQPDVTIPFRVLSADAGSSTWQVTAPSVAHNLFVVAQAAMIGDAADPDAALDRMVAYGNALVAPSAFTPMQRPLKSRKKLASITKLPPNIINYCVIGGPCVAVNLFNWIDGAATASVLAPSPIIQLPYADTLDELQLTNGVPSPQAGPDDPPKKTALFILPFKYKRQLHYQTKTGPAQGNNGTPVAILSWNDDLKMSTQNGAVPSYNYDDVEQFLTANGYTVTELADDPGKPQNAAVIIAIISQLLSGAPGILLIDTHGDSAGDLFTDDAQPITDDEIDDAVKWQAALDRFVASLPYDDLKQMEPDGKGGMQYVMFGHALKYEGPLPKQGVHGIRVRPAFWSWLRTKKQVDFSHSLVYVGACSADTFDATIPPDKLLRNAFLARAFFGWGLPATAASTKVFYFMAHNLIRHTHTTEEAYYNVLRVLRTRQYIFPEDKYLDLFRDISCDKSRGNDDPCVIGTREALARGFHGYASDGSALPLRFMDAADSPEAAVGGWLTDPKPGNIWWLIFKARWFTASGEPDSLVTCWNAQWSMGMTGDNNGSCGQEAPGEVPLQNEVGYAHYLLTGTATPSTSLTLMPRWTWNDAQ
jgi:hypothetical protein